MVEHLLPGGVELPGVLLQQSLLGQGDGLFGSSEDLNGPLEVLGGLLRLHLSLKAPRWKGEIVKERTEKEKERKNERRGGQNGKELI